MDLQIPLGAILCRLSTESYLLSNLICRQTTTTQVMIHTDAFATALTGPKLPAGYDPIFYLHHANIDRILGFWEYT